MQSQTLATNMMCTLRGISNNRNWFILIQPKVMSQKLLTLPDSSNKYHSLLNSACLHLHLSERHLWLFLLSKLYQFCKAQLKLRSTHEVFPAFLSLQEALLSLNASRSDCLYNLSSFLLISYTLTYLQIYGYLAMTLSSNQNKSSIKNQTPKPRLSTLKT